MDFGWRRYACLKKSWSSHQDSMWQLEVDHIEASAPKGSKFVKRIPHFSNLIFLTHFYEINYFKWPTFINKWKSLLE